VVIGKEALSSRLPVATTPKLLGMDLVRLGLERAMTAAEAVYVVTSLVTKHGQGRFENDAGVRTYDNGFLVADPKEAYVVETAGHDWAVKRVRGGLGISNVHSLGTDWAAVSRTAEGRAIERGVVD
jgi:dipeptidase